MSEAELREIKNADTRHILEQALDYRHKIDDWVSIQSGALKTQLKTTIESIDSWIVLMFKLGQSIDSLDANPMLERDRQVIPQELATLKARLAKESNTERRAVLQKAINDRQGLLDQLEAMTALRHQNRQHLGKTLEKLEEVYTRIQALDHEHKSE